MYIDVYIYIYWTVYIYTMCSMYGIFIFIWMILGANVGEYSIHGAFGYI